MHTRTRCPQALSHAILLLCEKLTLVESEVALNTVTFVHVGIIPVLRMSPAPDEQDLSVMDDREGICDLYDIDHKNGN